jgi:hypothetical protein
MQLLSKFPIHPFVLSLFFIISLYLNNINEVPPSALIFPITVSIIVITAILIISKIINRKFEKISIYLSLIIVLVFSYGHVFLLFENFNFNEIEIRHRHILIAYGIIFIISILIIKLRINSKTAMPILNAVGLTVLFSTLILVPYVDVFNNNLNTNTFMEESIVFENDIRPDIYYIILDEYAGQKSLENYFKFNNDKFIEFLKLNGFHVMDNSNSNYMATNFAVPSIMNMEYVHQSKKNMGTTNSDSNILNAYQQNNVMNFLNQNDYKTINIYGGALEKIKISDQNLCGDKAIVDFHTSLTQTTMFWVIQKYQFINNINEIRFCAFHELEIVGERNNKPIFVFAHIKLPHDPFTIGSNGETVIPKKIDFGISSDNNKVGYLNQLEYANKMIMELIPKIISNSKSPPIIIIQSDHGSRFDIESIPSNQETLDEEDERILQRSYNSFSAFYFPDKSYEEIYDEMTPVNTFRIIFNKIFETELEILDDRMYFQFKDNKGIFSNITEIVRSP